MAAEGIAATDARWLFWTRSISLAAPLGASRNCANELPAARVECQAAQRSDLVLVAVSGGGATGVSWAKSAVPRTDEAVDG